MKVITDKREITPTSRRREHVVILTLGQSYLAVCGFSASATGRDSWRCSWQLGTSQNLPRRRLITPRRWQPRSGGFIGREFLEAGGPLMLQRQIVDL